MKTVSENSKKIMMISRDLGCDDFYSELDRILEIGVKEKVDVLLFALFTLDYEHITKESLRLKLVEYTKKYKKFILVEFADLSDFSDCTVVCFNNGQMKVFYQLVGKSNAKPFWKEALISELPNRIFNNDMLVLICGEMNLGLTVNKKTNKVEDPYKILNWLKDQNIKIILDPFHDTAVRYEVAYKKRELSKDERLVVSIWNRNPRKHHNAIRPFQIFYNRFDMSKKAYSFSNETIRKDIKIFICES